MQNGIVDVSSVTNKQNKSTESCFWKSFVIPIRNISSRSNESCVCPECFYGSRCQFSTKSISLSLDTILVYQIRPNFSFTRQRSIMKVGHYRALNDMNLQSISSRSNAIDRQCEDSSSEDDFYASLLAIQKPSYFNFEKLKVMYEACVKLQLILLVYT